MPTPFRVFLASSSELAAEREALEICVSRINKRWNPDGIFVHVAIWEDFIDTVSRTRKQDDYNAAVRGCDLYVILVHHRLGKYSAEEFETAYGAFMAEGKPRLLVYLKDPPAPRQPDPGEHYDTVRTFRQRLASIDHFPTRYSTVAELLNHFGRQLDKLRDAGSSRQTRMQAPRNCLPLQGRRFGAAALRRWVKGPRPHRTAASTLAATTLHPLPGAPFGGQREGMQTWTRWISCCASGCCCWPVRA